MVQERIFGEEYIVNTISRNGIPALTSIFRYHKKRMPAGAIVYRGLEVVVEPDDKGLFITADLGGTEIGRELYEEIRGGYTDRMSFGFTVNGEYEESRKTDEGVRIYIRHITSVAKLYDVSAVSLPANDGTSIEADATTRSIGNLTDGVIERIQAERLEEQRIELERRRAEVRARALLGGNN